MSRPAAVGGSPIQPELVAVARACLAGGGTIDQAARAVLECTQSPIAAIVALRVAQPGLSLAEAKPLVHRNLPPDAQRAARRLWDEIERELDNLQS